jgi:serine/threonine protein kinase
MSSKTSNNSSNTESANTLAPSRIKNDMSRQVFKLLGEGAFGQVYKFEDVHDDEYPVKIIKRNFHRKYDFWGFISEFDILNLINGHPHLIKLLKCCHKDSLTIDLPLSRRDHDPFYFVFEAGTQDLFTWLDKRHGVFNESRYHRAKRLALDIALGMCQLHELGIMHRDLKTDNVIVVRSCVHCDTYSDSDCDKCDYRAKIIDFGTATFVCPVRLPADISTVEYQAPECWAGSYYDEKIDVWAYSLILYAIILGTIPCNIKNEYTSSQALNALVSHRVSDDSRDDIISTIGKRYGSVYDKNNPLNTRLSLQKRYGEYVPASDLDQACDLIMACSRFNPSKRYSSQQIANHPWFNEFKDEVILKKYKRNEEPVHIIKNGARNKIIPHIESCLNDLDKGTQYYTYRDLMHAIRLFDKCNQYEIKLPVTTFYLCLYICIKFFSCLEGAVKFSSIYKTKRKYELLARDEYRIVNEYLNGEIYHPYIYECCVADHQYSDYNLLLTSMRLILEGDVNGMLPSQIVELARSKLNSSNNG